MPMRSFSTKLSETNSWEPAPGGSSAPQIINDMMGKNGGVGINVLIAQGSLLAQKGLASA
jgi:hypothetical protein